MGAYAGEGAQTNLEVDTRELPATMAWAVRSLAESRRSFSFLCGRKDIAKMFDTLCR